MWKAKVIDLSNDTVTVSTVGVKVYGVYVNTAMSAHPCSISNGSTPFFIIPASTTAGTAISFAGEKGVLFDVNLIVNPDNAATGGLTIMYQDQK